MGRKIAKQAEQEQDIKRTLMLPSCLILYDNFLVGNWTLVFTTKKLDHFNTRFSKLYHKH